MSPLPKISDEIFIRVFLWKTKVYEKSLTNNRKIQNKVKDKEFKMKDNEKFKLFDNIYEELKKENPAVTFREALCAWDWKVRTLDGDERFGGENCIFNIDDLVVSDDVKIEFYTKNGGLFNIWFNTWFVHNNVLQFSKMELDKGFKDEKQFAKNFIVTLRFEETETIIDDNFKIPVSKTGIRDDIPEDIDDINNVPPLPNEVNYNADANPGECLNRNIESVIKKRVYAPEWYPIYHLSLHFKNYEKIFDYLLKMPECEDFNTQKHSKLVKKTTRDPVEVSRSILYAILQLYLRAGFYGRVLDYHIESIYLDCKEQLKLFEAQASELAVIDLEKIPPTGLEAFWLNIYHIMFLHAMIYWKHRPLMELKDMLPNFKKFTYCIGALKYSLYEVLMGNLRGAYPKDDSIDKPVIFQATNPRSKYIVKEKDSFIGMMINFGYINSPPIWMYDVENFPEQREMAVNHYLNSCAAALGNGKTLYLPSHMKLFTKDFKNEKQMTKEMLRRHDVEEKEMSSWSLKYQQPEKDITFVFTHLIEQDIVVTHRDVNFLGQSSLFKYQKPAVKKRQSD